jgi:hypothetical protein
VLQENITARKAQNGKELNELQRESSKQRIEKK